jgi:hypothetical protein
MLANYTLHFHIYKFAFSNFTQFPISCFLQVFICLVTHIFGNLAWESQGYYVVEIETHRWAAIGKNGMDYDCLVPDIATGPFLAHQVSCFLALKACIKITA